MRALSIRQPWAWCILHAGKRIENRTWACHYRGDILIHASKTCSQQDHDDAEEGLYRADLIGDLRETEDGQPLPTLWIPDIHTLPRGGIVGRARIVACLRPRSGHDTRKAIAQGIDLRWWIRDEAHGFVFEDVEPLPFVAWPGARGLFDVPDDYATRGPPQPPAPHPELFPVRHG